MAQPGPNSEEELVRFLFDRPTVREGRTCQKVLLVLEDVDSLFEGGGDARDRVLKLLSNLCSKSEHLKLLVTSEQSLQRDTNERFRHGSERVAKVKPLKDRDAAQLLMDKVPTRFTKKELRLSTHCCTREDILKALEAHPVLKAAEGHPGTLLRLAPLLEDHNVNDACVLQRAKQHRLEYQQETHALRRNSRASSTTSLASSAGVGPGMGAAGGGGLPNGASDMSLGNMGGRPMTPTQPHPLGHAISHDTHFQQQQQQQQHNVNGSSPFFHQDLPTWAGGGEMHHPLLNGAGMAGGSSIHSSGIGGSGHGTHPAAAAAAAARSSSHPHHPHHHRRRHSSHPQSPTQTHRPQRRMTVMNQLMAQVELEEPDPPQMTPEEKRAWDTARTAGLMDRGCRLVWVKATTNALLNGWRYDDGGGAAAAAAAVVKTAGAGGRPKGGRGRG
ncbi:unnamed protein product, partial [Ectocarpus fasciculatus]